MVVIRFGHDWEETCMQMDEVRWRSAFYSYYWEVFHDSACTAESFCKHLVPSRAGLSHLKGRLTMACHNTQLLSLLHTQILASTADMMKNFAAIYLVDIGAVSIPCVSSTMSE